MNNKMERVLRLLLEYTNYLDLKYEYHDENFENIYLKVKETCDKYFKRKNHKKNLTRRELAYLLLRDEDRLEEEVYLFDMEDSKYLHLDEISSEYVDVVKEGTKEEKLRSFTEEGIRYYNKNKIGQKRITILS